MFKNICKDLLSYYLRIHLAQLQHPSNNVPVLYALSLRSTLRPIYARALHTAVNELMLGIDKIFLLRFIWRKYDEKTEDSNMQIVSFWGVNLAL